MSALANRLQKNARHLKRWAERQGLTAWRIYDLDMPEYPFGVDWYDGHVHAQEFFKKGDPKAERCRLELADAVQAVLGVPRERLHLKTHEAHRWGASQYGAGPGGSVVLVVREGECAFEVNLTDHLDTGLFLDHRVLRQRVGRESAGRRVLNLFAYTGAFTVHAAKGGARETVSVDLSNTYCAWAERNLRLNEVEPGPRHRVVAADAVAWLEGCRERFDVVVLDPPSFSTSKKMRGSLDVQRDQLSLVGAARALLAPGGTLYFSTNYRGFALHPKLSDGEELDTLPEDFRRPVHRTFRFGPAAG